MTLIKPDRKPANLGEAGGTHGEDFSPPVGCFGRSTAVGDPWTRQTVSTFCKEGLVWDRAAVSLRTVRSGG